MASTSTTYINISIVFDNIHVLWMCRWTHNHHHAVTSKAVGTHFGTLPKSWFTPPHQLIPCTVVEADISIVFDNIRVLRMCTRWTHHHVVTPTAVGTHFGALPKSWLTPPQQMIPWCTVVEAEALHPHGMAFTSTTSIYLMCLRPFML